MLSLRDFWRRHRRKIIIASGVLGSGYFLYKLYNAHKCRLAELERELASNREHDELINAQVLAHFENIQRIADTTTLPHAMHYLSSRIAEELDLSQLTERLMKGKGQPNALTPSEKLELWDRLKILSFTRLVVSLWAMTMLSLYIRTQVNILGRHLYLATARVLGSSDLIEDIDLIERDGQQKFLASSDFFANSGILALSSDVQLAAAEVLKGKQLRDFFNTATLHETIMQILDLLMSRGSPHHWVEYLMPADARFDKRPIDSSSDDIIMTDGTKFEQLMAEARAVISSAEFLGVVEKSLEVSVDALVADMGAESSGGSLMAGMPLARLVPRVAQMGPLLLEEPSRNRFLQIIWSIPQVEGFFSALYANQWVLPS
ncbi:peroxisome biogenesis protein 3-2 isoform X1 [Ricinus communis]|uniref:peroxisome biogenesis protein 3-2 isoform X1 n=1 Tax=Ricinus communis TaxID=3988 RepID=UPI00201AF0A1|nr:peroxisome biogenesis protein 3-2 isoform X1 [Ricinus communis]